MKELIKLWNEMSTKERIAIVLFLILLLFKQKKTDNEIIELVINQKNKFVSNEKKLFSKLLIPKKIHGIFSIIE